MQFLANEIQSLKKEMKQQQRIPTQRMPVLPEQQEKGNDDILSLLDKDLNHYQNQKTKMFSELVISKNNLKNLQNKCDETLSVL